MAVGLKVPDVIAKIDGVELSAISCGVKASGGTDLVLLKFSEGTNTASVFTQNAFCAAPIVIAKEHLKASEGVRALLINSGNANAGTGAIGLSNARYCCKAVADIIEIDANDVLPFSTGVISQQLNMNKLSAGIDQLNNELQPDNWHSAAIGIMTTDTLPKIVSRQTTINNFKVSMTGICKGAGMIRPDMATLLSFIATDAKVDPDDLQACLESAVSRSFNAISIDGDTSTNDACTLSATGKVGGNPLTRKHPEWWKFQSLVDDVCRLLAQSIIRDGEGATKFITVNVEQGGNEEECREVAYTLAHSPLVKTAFFASDPNVGRLLAAVGRSRIENLNIASICISLDEVDVVINAEPADSYTEERGQMVMDREEITINVRLARGESSFTLWTCDLSTEYVRINADYRS